MTGNRVCVFSGFLSFLVLEDRYFEAPKGPELEQDRSALSVCGENLLDYIEIK